MPCVQNDGKYDYIHWSGTNTDAVLAFYAAIVSYPGSDDTATVNDDGSLYLSDSGGNFALTVPSGGYLLSGPYWGVTNTGGQNLAVTSGQFADQFSVLP